MIRRVLIAAACGAAMLVPVMPSSDAHAGGSFCEGFFVQQVEGPYRPSDDTAFGHGEGYCSTAFQGLPAGVIGIYEAGADPAPANIHVEVWTVLATGQRLKMAECESSSTSGHAECDYEDNPLGESVTIAEPLPDLVVRVECIAHSHARVKQGTSPIGRFGCYTTDEAREELREDMGL